MSLSLLGAGKPQVTFSATGYDMTIQINRLDGPDNGE